MGNFTGPIRVIFSIFPSGPYSQEKIESEIAITTETRETPERNDTICGSPSLFSFIVTEGENKNGHFDAPVRD